MIRSVAFICRTFPILSHISSSMSLFISGTCATIFYSSEAYPPCISVRFARSLRRRSQLSGSLVPLCVTAATSTGAFTAVLDALVDPLCEEDVVLGKDWIDRCASNNVLPQLELPPVYYSGELVLMNLSHPLTWTSPQRYRPFSYQSDLPFLQVRRLFFSCHLSCSHPLFLGYLYIVVALYVLRTCSICLT